MYLNVFSTVPEAYRKGQIRVILTSQLIVQIKWSYFLLILDHSLEYFFRRNSASLWEFLSQKVVKYSARLFFSVSVPVYNAICSPRRCLSLCIFIRTYLLYTQNFLSSNNRTFKMSCKRDVDKVGSCVYVETEVMWETCIFLF